MGTEIICDPDGGAEIICDPDGGDHIICDPDGYGAVLSEKSPSKQTHLKVDGKLKLLNKRSLKTIQTEYGDVIDCVDIYQQPAFEHPSLKNHTIQMKPSFNPLTKSKNGTSTGAMSQSWRKSGSCPIGTIPILRIWKATSLENYGKKNPYITPSQMSTTTEETNDDRKPNYLYVNRSTAILMAEGNDYKGAKARISIWNPEVENAYEYSTAHIRLVFGSGDQMESVEAGWMVYPILYGDSSTRFFIHWTVDGSNRTGCFNLVCTGFVQTSNEVSVGCKISPILDSGFISSIMGYCISGYIHKQLVFGGEVYSETIGQERKGVKHTTTEMGSGEQAKSGFMMAASIKEIRILDGSQIEEYPNPSEEYSDEPNIYSTYNEDYDKEDQIFYFGGGRL
ncbi:uncharacterized protein LOC113351601 [Papaver somniferum]|uniref:uncharacterized protein LOC113351601 n=1 Tax=Papaver somniferum TaxID=3469 RepID=UPI000E702285|nr:uncharacterized protein LOC113351601 [Papaver somniferum]